MSENQPRETDLTAVARDAYVFFYPMLMGYRFLFGAFLAPGLPSHQGPLNTLCGVPRTLDATFRDVVTPNADTPYSMAGLDLRAEPVVLSVPEVTDRFYHFQLEDLWGHNVHYVGVRTTGTDGGAYLLAGPGWTGRVPPGITAVLHFETDVVFVIGRTQLLGPDDIEGLSGVMAAYDLRPLSARAGEQPLPAPPYDWPVWNDAASRDERFIGFANALLPLCGPTHPEDAPHLERFAAIGVGPGAPFDAEALPAATREALRQGVAEARDLIEAATGELGKQVDGWAMTEVFGDRASYHGDVLRRAAGAMAGWGGNDASEALYPMARTDVDGEPLHGDHAYRITVDAPLPARAFWSFTMYDTTYDGTAGYLVDNPIDRYLVNSTTPGLVRGDDGTLTLHLQHDEPTTPEGRANWLPAPEGPFYVVLRLYEPEPTALDGTWSPPPIRRVDGS